MGGRTRKSKRQFDGNPEQRWRHEPFILFLDETLHNCQPILEVLREIEVHYERHGGYFAAGTEDKDWLPFVGDKRWTLLTHDQKIRYNQLEIQKVVQNRLREFVFTSGQLSGAEMAAVLKKAMPKMKRLFKKREPPFIATLSKSGTVTVRYDKEGSVHYRNKQAKNTKA